MDFIIGYWIFFFLLSPVRSDRCAGHRRLWRPLPEIAHHLPSDLWRVSKLCWIFCGRKDRNYTWCLSKASKIMLQRVQSHLKRLHKKLVSIASSFLPLLIAHSRITIPFQSHNFYIYFFRIKEHHGPNNRPPFRSFHIFLIRLEYIDLYLWKLMRFGV